MATGHTVGRCCTKDMLTMPLHMIVDHDIMVVVGGRDAGIRAFQLREDIIYREKLDLC